MRLEEAFWVELSGVAGTVEFDSSFARAVRDGQEDRLHVDCVVMAESGEEAIRRAREQFGGGGEVETVVRLDEKVLPRMVRAFREGDTTLGRVARSGVRIRFRDRTLGGDLEYQAIFQGWNFASGFLMEAVEVTVWEKQRTSEILQHLHLPFESGGGEVTLRDFERLVLRTRTLLEEARGRVAIPAEWNEREPASPSHLSAMLSAAVRRAEEGHWGEAWRDLGYVEGVMLALGWVRWEELEDYSLGQLPRSACAFCKGLNRRTAERCWTCGRDIPSPEPLSESEA